MSFVRVSLTEYERTLLANCVGLAADNAALAAEHGDVPNVDSERMADMAADLRDLERKLRAAVSR